MTALRGRPRPRRQVTRRNAKTFSLNAIAVLVALLTLFPIFWMVSTAFKPSQEIYSLTPDLWPAHPTLGNFHAVFSGQASGIGSYWLFFRNSMLVTLCTVLLASLVSLLASIAVARFRFRFRASYLIMLLIVQMIPGAGADHRAVPRLQPAQPAAEPARPDPGVRRAGAAGVDLDAAQLRGHRAPGAGGGGRGGRRRAAADLLAHPVPADRPGPDRDQRVLVHHRVQRVHRGADVPRPGALGTTRCRST